MLSITQKCSSTRSLKRPGREFHSISHFCDLLIHCVQIRWRHRNIYWCRQRHHLSCSSPCCCRFMGSYLLFSASRVSYLTVLGICRLVCHWKPKTSLMAYTPRCKCSICFPYLYVRSVPITHFQTVTHDRDYSVQVRNLYIEPISFVSWRHSNIHSVSFLAPDRPEVRFSLQDVSLAAGKGLAMFARKSLAEASVAQNLPVSFRMRSVWKLDWHVATYQNFIVRQATTVASILQSSSQRLAFPLATKLTATGRENCEIASNVLDIAVSTSINQAYSIARMIDLYLDDDRTVAKEHIIDLVKNDTEESNALLKGYVSEALRAYLRHHETVSRFNFLYRPAPTSGQPMGRINCRYDDWSRTRLSTPWSEERGSCSG